MNSTLIKKLRNGAASAVVTLAIVGGGMTVAPTPAYAVYCSNCSTFYQQMFEYAEQVNTALNTAEQLSTQIRQYQNMITNGISLPNSMFGRITQDLQQVISVYNRSQALGRNVANLDESFNTSFPGYQDYLKRFVNSSGTATGTTMQSQYKKWSQNGMDSVKNSMAAANMNTGAFEKEDAALDKIVARSQSAVGRQQALQAGNEIAAANVQQLQKLRDLLATQIQMQGNYMAQEIERKGVDDAIRAQRRGGELKDTGRNKEY